MPQCPCHHIAVSHYVAVLFFCSPDHTGYVLTDTRFFCYDCYHDSDKVKPFPVSRLPVCGGTGNGGYTFSLHIIYKEGLLLSDRVDAKDFEQRSAVLAHQL